MDCRRQNNDFDLITFGPISPVGPGFPLGPTAPCDEEAGKLTLVETIYLRTERKIPLVQVVLDSFATRCSWGTLWNCFWTMPQVMTII